MKDRARLVAIERAVREGFADALDRAATVEQAVRRTALKVMAKLAGDDAVEPRERPAERRRRENAEALVHMGALERQGKRRAAAMMVAKRMAVDPSDALEVEVIAQRLRRLRRRQK